MLVRSVSLALSLVFLVACGRVKFESKPAMDAAPSDTGSDSRPGDSAVTDGGTDAAVDAALDARTRRPDAELDSGVVDSAVMDAGADGGTDGAVDGAVDADVGTDAGADAAMDAGCIDPAWGVSDDDTSDVAGDIFGTQTWVADVCVPPLLGQRIPLEFRARITAMGTEFPFDFFGTYVVINGVGGSRDTFATWDYITVTGAAFADYVLILPADIDGDGTVDWTAGANTIQIRTWSDYNPRPSKSGLDYLRLGRP